MDMNRLLIGLLLLCTGCTTGGLVIGPVSYLSAESNTYNLTRRTVLMSDLEPVKKTQVFSAMYMGADGDEARVAFGADIGKLIDAIKNGELTWTELGKQAVAVIIDAGILAKLGDMALDEIKGKDKEEPERTVLAIVESGGCTVTIYK
jgi:hypothetical protein